MRLYQCKYCQTDTTSLKRNVCKRCSAGAGQPRKKPTAPRKYKPTPKRNRITGRRWMRIRELVFRRDKQLCQHCLKAGVIKAANQVDHITPLGCGGTDDLCNLQALCKPCHDLKTIDDRVRIGEYKHQNKGKPRRGGVSSDDFGFLNWVNGNH